MDPLSITASAIALYGLAEEIAKLCISFTSEAKHAPRDMRHFADEVVQFQRSMLQLRFMLAERDEDSEKLHKQQFLETVVGPDASGLQDCQKELDILLSRLQSLLSTSGLAKLKAKLSWPLKSDEAVRIIERLRSIRDRITNAAALDTYDLLRDVSARQQTAEKSTEIRQKKVDAEAEERKRLEELRRVRKGVLEWLRHPDPSENHNIACSARNNRIKAGSWLFDSKTFRRFQTEPKSLLWLYGIAGSGKSVLCSTVIEHLQDQAHKENNIKVAYWYFNANDKQRMSFDSFWRALIVQFLPVSIEDTPSAILELWQMRSAGGEAPKQTDLSAMIRKLVASDPSIQYYIAIDAFDEANPDPVERETCLSVFDELLSADISSLHVFITSRPNEEVRNQLNESISQARLDLEIQPDHDIAKHISDQLENDRVLSRWPKQQRERIKDTLVGKAGGMFRWIDLQLQALRKCKRPADLDRTLSLLPKNLFDQYKQELENIDDIDAEDALRLLQWLAFPQRKLRLDEAVEMLAVTFETDPPHFEEERRMFNPRQVLEICGSLVRIDTTKEGRDHRGAVARVDTLTTAHSTVLDFLKTKTFRIGSLAECEFKSAPINLHMAETCLAYLHDLVEKNPDLTHNQLKEYPFARYCAEFWDDQYRQAQAEAEGLDFTRVNRMVHDLLENRVAVLVYIRLCDPDFEYYTADFSMQAEHVSAPLYYAALHGLLDITKELISAGADLEVDNPGYYGTALCVAAAMGRLDEVKILIDAGADPMNPSSLKGYPIAVAVENDHRDVAEFLLQQDGADMNCRRMPEEIIEKRRQELEARPPSGSSSVKSSLSKSASWSSLSSSDSDSRISSEQSESDSNETDAGGDHSSSERGRSSSGTESSKGRDSSSESSKDRDSSSESSTDQDSSSESSNDSSDQESKSGTDIDSYGGNGTSDFTDTRDDALAVSESLVYIAATYTSTKTLQFLLEAGADPNIEGGSAHTALITACQVGSLPIIETLLLFGARVDLYGGMYGSALQAACENSDMLPIIKKLIHAGIDIGFRGPTGETALFRSCWAGELEYVRLLLESGAAYDEEPGQTPCKVPLVAAAFKGHLSIVELLLTSGADVNRQDSDYGCALCAATNSNEIEIARLLIQHSANVNESGCKKYGNCLLAATLDSDVEMMELFLDNGADINVQHSVFGSVLQFAVSSWDTATVKCLLDRGASPNTRGGRYGLPLLRACKHGDTEIIECLLEKGADPCSVVVEDVNNLDFGGTCLRYCKDEDDMSLLIARGADVNENVGLLGTPLTFNARQGSMRSVKALVSVGAKLEETDKLRLMTALLHAADRGDVQMGQYLISKGANIHAQDRLQRSALMLGICGGHVSVVKGLKMLDLSAESKDARGVLAIHYAAGSHAFPALEKLLPHVVQNINVADPQGWTPLHWAIQCCPVSMVTVKRLLELGADKSIKDKRSRTPIDLAKEYKATDIAALLAVEPQKGSVGQTALESASEGVKQHECDTCKGTRRFHYECEECLIFQICSRCFVDKDIVHEPGHKFNQLPDLRPDLPTNQDPSIPDIPEDNSAVAGGADSDLTTRSKDPENPGLAVADASPAEG